MIGVRLGRVSWRSLLALGLVSVVLSCETDKPLGSGDLTEPKAESSKTDTSVREALTGPPTASGFVAYGQNSTLVRRNALVSGGDVGTKDTGNGPVLLLGNRALIGDRATVGVGDRLFADSLFLSSGSRVGNVLANRITDRGALKGTVSPFVSAAMPALPTLAANTPGTAALTVSGTKQICPGKYGAVVVNANGILRLSAGLYEISSLRLLDRARVEALGQVQIRIKTQLRTRQQVYIGPASGAALTANGIRIEIAGPDADDPDADSWEARLRVGTLGWKSEARAVILARNGVFVVVNEAKLRGALLAKDVVIGDSAQVTFEDGFGVATTPPPACDDANVCTRDTCNSNGTCSYANVTSGTSCSDNDACNGVEVCNGAGACAASAPPAIDDGNACTADSCDAATGVKHTPLPVGTACSDGNACNGAEACNAAGTCQPGTAPTVDDNNPCTTDACNPSTGITHTPVGAGTSCSDNNMCNGSETCNATGICAPGQAPPVDDGNPCTVDACNPSTGVTHTPVAPGTACGDSNVCNGSEVCNPAGGCSVGTPLVVDDGNPCTADSCDPVSGVAHAPLMAGTACGDANACNGSEVCNGAGACQPGSPPVLDDGNVCTVDACDPALGVTHAPVSAGGSCANGTICDGTEICDGAGRCMPGTPVVFEDGNPCTVDACDPITGAVHQPAASGTACGTGDLCSGQATCDGAGNCMPGVPATVDDGNPCTADLCDPAGGVSHPPIVAGTSCADTTVCNGAETCDGAGTCQPGAAPSLDDGDPCTADACDPISGVSHTPIPSCNPDPATIAPPVDPTVTTTIYNSTQFLYTGANPIQPGVTAGAIAPLRTSVLHGRVKSRDGGGLAGVDVFVVDHPEFGHTFTRNNGAFDMVVNGGGPLTIRYFKAGYAPADRQVESSWQEHTWADELVMVQYDAQVTTVDLSLPTLQVARGSVNTDASGSRQATLFVQPGTAAMMELPGGATSPLSTFHVRATEFTVGDSGPAAMPAVLPAPSAYTYCVDFSVDEAVAAGAQEVHFSKPVIFYLENFLNFPVSTGVPLGYYEFGSMSWAPANNGVIIRVLAGAGGLAGVDTNGDGNAESAATLASLGITDLERQQLAALYPAGQTLWRMPLNHFSSWDANWGIFPPRDAVRPKQNFSAPPDEPLACVSSGSVIECQNQNLGEDFGIAGTPFGLHYRSDRMPGRGASRTLDIPLTGATMPASATGVHLEVDVAGQHHEFDFGPGTNQTTSFTWDGKDVYGRTLEGSQPIHVGLGYKYRGEYQAVTQFGTRGNGILITGSPARDFLTFWQDWNGKLGTFKNGAGLGGLSITPHHQYDVLNRKLYLGNGSRRDTGTLAPIISTYQTPVATGMRGMAFAPDGTLYFSEGQLVYRRTPDGQVSIYAGGGTSFGFVPARSLNLNVPQDLALGPDGSLYIGASRRVFRVLPNGMGYVIAGNGSIAQEPGCCNNVPANTVPVSATNQIAVGPDSTLYIGSWGNLVPIQRVGTDGILTLIGGTGSATALALGADGTIYYTACAFNQVFRLQPDGTFSPFAGASNQSGFAGDGGPALQAKFACPTGLNVGRDGSVYVADSASHRIRKIGTDGIISTVVGGAAPLGSFGFVSGDGGPAISAGMVDPKRMAEGADGSFYVFDNFPGHIRRVAPAMPGLGVGDFFIPSEDGTEAYVFNSAGKHLRTRNALTGTTVYQFAYDPSGLLSSITDVDGNVTTVQRSPAGDPLTVVGPFGHRTTLALDGNGFVSRITNPANESVGISYTGSGLLTGLTDPRGNPKAYDYDTRGRLIRAEDQLGAAKTLTRTTQSNGYTVTKTTAEGRATSYRVESLASAGSRWTNTFPDGLQTVTNFSPTGTDSTTSPDGTSASTTKTADPRFGMLAPLPASTTRMPSGLTRSTGRTREVTVPAPGAPPTSITDRETINGSTWTSTYQSSTRAITIQTPAGRTATLVFDAKGRVTSSQSAGLSPIALSYDERGRVSAIVQGARTRSWTYDTEGNIASMTDSLGRTRTFSYDPTGRLIERTTPDGRVIGMGYDANGNITNVTPPNRLPHTMQYTPVDLMASYEPPPIGLPQHDTSYSYNTDQQMTRLVRPDGKMIDIGYDAAGRLATIAAPHGTTTQSYNSTTGKVSMVVAPAGRAGAAEIRTYGYDGDLLLSTSYAGPIIGTISRTYNPNFAIASESINGAETVAYAYDADQLLQSVGASVLTRSSQNGMVTGVTVGSIAEDLTHDEFGQLASQATNQGGTSLFGVTYIRDLLGRITTREETVLGVTHTYTYSYNLAGRLEEVGRDGAMIVRFTYDDNTNRTSTMTPTSTVLSVYDAQDRLLSHGGSTYQYNANGDLAAKQAPGGITEYEYDAWGNLQSAVMPDGKVVDYAVDGLNQRVGKLVNGALQQGFLYDNEGYIVAELDGVNHVVSRFVYASRDNVPDYMVRAGTTYRILSDHLGSPRLVVDLTTGQTVQEIEYDVWGKVTLDSNPGFQPFGFGGGLYDVDTGLVRFGVRDYDAEVGRWTSKDPIRFDGGSPNLYSYVQGDPVNFVDISGRKIRPTVKVDPDPHNKLSKRQTCSGADGGTCFDSSAASDPCTRRKSGWGFDVDFEAEVWSEYGVDPESESCDSPGMTLAQHENEHRKDYAKACRSGPLNEAIKTEGFKSKNLCEQGRSRLDQDLNRYIKKVGRKSRERIDRCPNS